MTDKRRSKTIIEIDHRIEEQEQLIAAATQKRSTLLELRESFLSAEAKTAKPKAAGPGPRQATSS